MPDDGFDAAGDSPAVDVTGAQGDAASQSSSPWDPWISEQEIPEPAQHYVRNAFKHAEGLTTKRFQEAAEFRKQWEPYQQVGIHEWDPQGLQQGLALLEALEDEERGPEVIRQLAEHYGVLGGDDEVDDDEDGEDEPDINSVLDEKLAPIQQFIQSQQQERIQQEAQSYFDDALKQIKKDAGRDLSDEEQTRVLQIAQSQAKAGEKDPIGSAWGIYKSIITDAERGVMSQKRQEPGRAEVGPSRPAATPDRGDLPLEDQGKQELREWARARAQAA